MSREYRFEIVWGRDRQVLLRDVRLASPAPLKLAYTGWGMRVFPAPSVSGGPSERREPPLEILRSRFKDGGRSVEFYIHKPGTGFAVGVRWEIAAWIADRWQHIATGTIERIDAGRDTLVSRGGFPPTADKAQIKIVSPAPEISAVLTQSTIDLNPSNCHVRMSDRGGVVDVGLGISNFGEREAGQFLWEIRKYRGNIWIPFHSQRVDSIRAGGRYAQGSIFIRSGDIQRKEPLQIVVDTENAIRESNEGNNVCEVTWGSDY
ncbi:MAG TPA: CARDB domain-containing protein [Acidobacteriota bacterium]|nr:CARDB domain-containing protein [Acidobacteriota bacterium]